MQCTIKHLIKKAWGYRALILESSIPNGQRMPTLIVIKKMASEPWCSRGGASRLPRKKLIVVTRSACLITITNSPLGLTESEANQLSQLHLFLKQTSIHSAFLMNINPSILIYNTEKNTCMQFYFMTLQIVNFGHYTSKVGSNCVVWICWRNFVAAHRSEHDWKSLICVTRMHFRNSFF